MDIKDNKVYEIEEFLKSIYKPLNGLSLLMAPPGSGKSYETSLFINYLLSVTNRLIYYVTPRLDNVDELYDDLLVAMKNDNEKIDKVLKIDSYKNCVLNNLEYLKNDITASWSLTNELIRNINKYNSTSDIEFKEILEKKIFLDKDSLEKKFRTKLRIEFKKSYKKHDDIYKSTYEYMKNSKWSFIEKIYPSTAFENKQVFVLSSSKFFTSNDPIIKNWYSFTDKEVIKDAIIIIDEIDAIKVELLDRLVNNNETLNVIRIFKEIYNKLQDLDSIDENMLNINHGKCKERLENLKKESDELKNKFFPNNNIKLLLKDEEDNKLRRIENTELIMNYIGVHVHPVFRGEQFCSYLPANEKNNYHKNRQTDETCNLILEQSQVDFKNDDAYPLWYFVNIIKKFVFKVFRNFNYIAEDYQIEQNNKIADENSKEEELVTLDNARTTVFSNMNFRDGKDDLKKYIDIMHKVTKSGMYKYTPKDKKDYSIYSKGLYYTCVYESNRTRDNSQLRNYELFITPELELLNLCTYAHVIGISATARVPSINNFNWEYLEAGLKDRGIYMHEASEEIVESLKKGYERKTGGYKKYDINSIVKSIKVENANNSKVFADLAFLKDENYTENDRLAIEFNSNINWKCKKIARNDRKNDYNALVKIWKYIKDVMKLHKEEKVISNGIIIANKGIKSNDDEIYTLDNIKLGAAFSYMGIYNTSYKEAENMVNDMFIYINSSKLKEYKKNDIENMVSIAEMKHIKDAFKEEKLIFMITTYNSVSRGNNLQIKVGEEEVKRRLKDRKIFEINDIFKKYDCIDWDSIYMEKPSYIIPNLRECNYNIPYEEKLKVLFTVEDICEREKISVNNKKKILNDVFMAFSEKENRYFNGYNLLYGMQSVKNAYTVNLYQTIGRITRTNLRKKYNAIYYDYNIIDIFETDKLKTNLQNTTKEFEIFRQTIKKEQYMRKLEYKENVYEEFSLQNKRCKAAIESILNEANKENWNKDNIGFWEMLRHEFLKNPNNRSKHDINRLRKKFNKFDCVNKYAFDFADCFFEFDTKQNKYFYRKEGEEIYISKTNKKNSKQSKNYPLEVSIDDSRLSYFKYDNDIMEYFKEKGYCTDWGKDSKYMMNPYVYQAIYKGALGEEILKAVFEKKCAYKVESIKEVKYYEKFDFIVKCGDRSIFVDAKNYSEDSFNKEFANKKLLLKLKEKVETMNIDKCFIINVIDEKGDRKIGNKLNFVTVPGIYTFNDVKKCILKNSTSIENCKVIDEIQLMILDEMEKNYD